MCRKLLAFIFVQLLLIATVPAANAGWLDALVRAGGKTAKPATHGAGALESAASHVKALPPRPDKAALAVAASHEGHWRFVNRTGETMTAATPDELARALNTLAPEAAKGGQLALYLTEDTVFAHRALLKDLPRTRELNVVIADKSYALIQQGEGAAARLYAEVRPGLIAELKDRRLFDAALWQLARPLNRANIRVIALEPGGPGSIPTVPKLDPATKRALTDAIDPDRLKHALPSIRGQTALVTGRIEGERLVFKPQAGPERSLLLGDLTAAAEAADVNLIVLRSSSPRQPGARNWLWQKVEVANLDTAIGSGTIADFLNALVGGQGRMLVSATEQGRLRTRLELEPARGLPGTPSANPVASAFNDLVAEMTAKVTLHGISAHVRSEERQEELDHRLIPGIPSVLQESWLSGLILGLLAWSVSRPWWSRIWPPEQAAEYGNAVGHWAARITRGVIFALVFLPLTGPFAFLTLMFRPLWRLFTRPKAE